ncbi:DUF5522 domain-containing protein [Desertivirga brevis]|uniref:DUF5522 domain-containing protein n=1 Tax=Desertivirga brevis TaxID=2810310 RepID=UPI001A971F99
MKEGEDYYLNDSGLLVFTATYHLKRGYCCKSGCLHCPWKKALKTKEQPLNNNSITPKIHGS